MKQTCRKKARTCINTRFFFFQATPDNLAKNVSVGCDVSAEGIQGAAAPVTVEAALVVEVILHGHLLGLVDGAAASSNVRIGIVHAYA